MMYIYKMTAPPKINRTTTLLALAALAVIAAGGMQKNVYAQSGTAGSFTDTRDGKKYRTVKIGNLTWMAENLNFKTGTSWCYENDESNCKKYGRLYAWETALKACPTGWRLSTGDDWDSLALAVGGRHDYERSWSEAGKTLKSKTGWKEGTGGDGTYYAGNGTDDFGFSALPGGEMHIHMGRANLGSIFMSIGLSAKWWSVNYNDGKAMSSWYRQILWQGDDLFNDGNEVDGCSVRCVKGKK